MVLDPSSIVAIWSSSMTLSYAFFFLCLPEEVMLTCIDEAGVSSRWDMVFVPRNII